jgi:hypothetical protein
VFSVEAFRIPALEFFSKDGDKAMSIVVRDDSGVYNSYSENISGLYLPIYVPQGYTVDSIDRVGSIYSVHYKNESDGYILFQNLIEGSAAQIDNEDVIFEEVIVHDQPAQLTMKNGMSNLLFKYQKNVFMLTGCIGKDDSIRMAESLEYYK